MGQGSKATSTKQGLEHEVSKAAKEHKLDIEYALLGLGRDSNVKNSVFKAPVARTKKRDINPLYIFINLLF